jgi:hypothetical protein
MADRRIGGISIGGIIVILGILVIIFWSFWIGLIVTLIGLIAFGVLFGASGTRGTERRCSPSWLTGRAVRVISA